MVGKEVNDPSTTPGWMNHCHPLPSNRNCGQNMPTGAAFLLVMLISNNLQHSKQSLPKA